MNDADKQLIDDVENALAGLGSVGGPGDLPVAPVTPATPDSPRVHSLVEQAARNMIVGGAYLHPGPISSLVALRMLVGQALKDKRHK